ncbi:hypothetical protein PZ04_06950 [Lacticaseibacillus rhamnosus]|nr:hypothetical protein PZ04_06950 [Lacticaseibacillus rhamnosus]
MAFSKETRTQTIDQLKQTELDLLIVGGGITGAGVAIQAAASGLKTGLIEMQDFAEGPVPLDQAGSWRHSLPQDF